MADIDRVQANAEARHAWNQNAAFWDARMGEGNDFVEVLIWPVSEMLLALHPGERVLDVACGNGLTSRRMAARASITPMSSRWASWKSGTEHLSQSMR
jgi:2-polyprenyl-3-methyl-5-hydroxy-6-metoxy-1,4-benzoquinol methylase